MPSWARSTGVWVPKTSRVPLAQGFEIAHSTVARSSCSVIAPVSPFAYAPSTTSSSPASIRPRSRRGMSGAWAGMMVSSVKRLS